MKPALQSSSGRPYAAIVQRNAIRLPPFACWSNIFKPFTSKNTECPSLCSTNYGRFLMTAHTTAAVIVLLANVTMRVSSDFHAKDTFYYRIFNKGTL